MMAGENCAQAISGLSSREVGDSRDDAVDVQSAAAPMKNTRKAV